MTAKRCGVNGLASLGRIVSHPVTAMMNTQALNHFIGCLHGISLIANGNRGRLPSRRNG